jgi:hypothetical protein
MALALAQDMAVTITMAQAMHFTRMLSHEIKASATQPEGPRCWL